MDIKGSVAHLAGRLLKPLRSGADKLAQHRLPAEERTLVVESDAFAEGAPIPDAYAGAHGRSPSVRWSNVPPDTRELVLLCEDPDAPMPKPFVHWIVYGLGPEARSLPEGLPPTGAPLEGGVQQGRNSMRSDGYLGPMPPPGHGVHHYHFQLFALNARLDLEAPVDRDQLVAEMRDHVLAIGELVGTYVRE